MLRHVALRHVTIVTLVAGAAAPNLAAQSSSIAWDASVGLSSGSQRHAVSAWYPVAHVWDRLQLDVGVRATSYGGDAAIYSNRGTVSGSFPSTLTITTGVLGLNAAVQAEVRLVSSLSAGFNLDLAGFATGATKASGALSAKAQSGSLFLGGSPDVGALNSETYLAWQLTDRVALRAGTTHYVTNYEASDPLAPTAASVRYQKFVTVPFVSVRVRF